MSSNKSKFQISLIKVVLCSLIVIAIMISIIVATSITAYYNNMRYQGEVLSKNYSLQYSNTIDNYADEKIAQLKDVSKSIHESDLRTVLKEQEKNVEPFWLMFYIDDSVMYDSDKDAVSMPNEDIEKFFNAQESGITGFFPYQNRTMLAVCYYHESLDYQMLVGFIDMKEFTEEVIVKFNNLIDLPSFYMLAVCNKDGEVLGQFVETEDGIGFDVALTKKIGKIQLENVYTSLNYFAPENIDKQAIEKEIKQDGNFSLFANVYSEDYIFSLFSPSNSNNNLLFAQIYNADSIIYEQNNFISIIISSIIVLILVVFILILLGLGYRNAWRRNIEYQENYDAITGCNTYKMFKDNFNQILAYNKYLKYAVVYIEIKQFDMLYENYGEDTVNDVITFCGKIINRIIDKTEIYGHLSNGKFIMLINYKNQNDIEQKLSMTYSLLSNYNKFKSVEFTLTFSAGVYLIKKGQKVNAEVCLNNAMVAQRNTNVTLGEYFCYYDEKLDEARQSEREIELRKEQAIAKREFQVYYQPKLGLASRQVDGAEALVRWYYPEEDKIYPPSRFMPIFEMNGFVEKLDRYVYLEVLKFMKSNVDKGNIICPVSVNVSRYTALKPDFANFYIENKKKYGIADGYICIEFTESFAFDNNKKLLEIVTTLRKNGMLCSIDDFGVGYSSYSVLKDLPMDEIKLDAFFMNRGLSQDRDEKTVRSVINLGKDLGMKVTQEGVETKEEMERLAEYGCDVVQGYYYSKPLSEDQFEEFLVNTLGVRGKINR